MRNNYISARIIEILSDNKLHTYREIANEIEAGKNTVIRHIRDLSVDHSIVTYHGGQKCGVQMISGNRIYLNTDEKSIIIYALQKLGNPETWTDFESACKYAKENGSATVAFALDGKDKVCCIDIDHCKDQNGNYSELAEKVLSLSKGNYVERSLSGEGLHVFGKTDGMDDLRSYAKDGDLEFYREARFISVTGDRVTETSAIKSIDGEPIERLLREKCERRKEWTGTNSGVEGLSFLSDREVVEKAFAAKNGETFKKLYDGEDLKNNHSNSDMQLLSYLAYWCNGDKDQMLRIFATSGLYRPEKSANYYESSAIKAIEFVPTRFQQADNANKAVSPKSSSSGNGRR